jgi:hypothetical protein
MSAVQQTLNKAERCTKQHTYGYWLLCMGHQGLVDAITLQLQ